MILEYIILFCLFGSIYSMLFSFFFVQVAENVLGPRIQFRCFCRLKFNHHNY